MKILVTGGAGFIGSHIVEHFNRIAEVRVPDNLRSGFVRNLEGLRHDLIAASVLQRERVRDAVRGVDIVFHAAAMVSVCESIERPCECLETNAAGTLILLEEAARAGVRKLILSSSADVYGDGREAPKSEDLLPAPGNPYGVAKLSAEHFCRLFADQGRLPTTSL